MIFGQVSVETQISERTVRVGDQLTLTISVTCPKDKSVKFSELTPESNGMSVLSEEITPESITYTLVFWEVGEFKIPGISFDILYHGQIESTLMTDPEVVLVESILTDQNEQIRDIKGMHEIQLHSPYLKYLFVLGIILSAIAIWVILRKRRKPVVKAEKWQKPKDSPRVRARKRLENLNCPYPITNKNSETFYLELTSIFKEYLENEFFFKAMEMTTGEIYTYLSASTDDEQLLEDTHQLLSSSDLSKFAKHIPEREKFQNDKVWISTIIDTFYQKIEKDLFTYNQRIKQ